MRIKLGMGVAVAAGLAAWVSTGVGAAAQESSALAADRERSSLREQCEALAVHEAEPLRVLSRSETPQGREPAAMDAPIHRSGVDEQRPRLRWQEVNPSATEGPAARSVKAVAQREAAQFGVIAVLSTLPRADADAPSPWARAAQTGRHPHSGVREPRFDGALDAPLVALR